MHIHHVSARRFDKVVLQDITWALRPQEHWAIIGPTGSGKSSLLDLLRNKLLITQGEVVQPFAKEDIALVPRDFSAYRVVGQAFQYYQQRFNGYDAELAPTVQEFFNDQVKPVGTIDEQSVELPTKAFTDAQLHEVAALLRVSHLLDRRLTSLSNGESRRVLMTKVLLTKPKLLLLDNPFVGLDVASRQTLHQVLNQLMESVTLVLVTTANEIPMGITHVMELEDGRIKAIDSAHAFRAKQHEHQLQTVAPAAAKRLLQRLESELVVGFEYMVRMRNVSVTYAGVNVLNRVNWEIKKGEKWALVGPNGSGKSTLLSLITADNPQSYANDFDLFDRKRGTGESIWDIKRQIGFVSPEMQLYSPRTSTVFQAVASGLFDATGLYKKLTEVQSNRVGEMLDLIEIAHLRDKTLLQLSTGQQRLVLLARALVKNPPLLILDEPCQGLDDEHIAYFKAVVEQLCGSPERTLIYVTHYDAEIPNVVTNVLRMNQGEGLASAYP
ncbi:MAG: ATP-binding cassette domain-containing protein [Spirosomataceae bacterium]